MGGSAVAIRISGIPQISVPAITPAAKPEEPTVASSARDFGQFLAEALQNVELAQQDAAGAAQRLASGEIRDVSEVTIASEKASLALQLTVQVRNKILEAYQEVMRMPV